MVDAGIQYKKQAFHGQTLRVEAGVSEISAKGFDLVYRVTEIESGDEVARAKSGLLCFNYREQKVVSIPDILLKKLTG
jgi:acyl-CoA thioesterase FadM